MPTFVIIHRWRGADRYLRDGEEMKWVEERRYACRYFKEQKAKELAKSCQDVLPGLVFYEPYEKKNE